MDTWSNVHNHVPLYRQKSENKKFLSCYHSQEHQKNSNNRNKVNKKDVQGLHREQYKRFLRKIKDLKQRGSNRVNRAEPIIITHATEHEHQQKQV